MSCMRTVKRFFCMKIIFAYNLYGGNRMPNTEYFPDNFSSFLFRAFFCYFCIIYFLSISALSNFHVILFFCQHIYWFCVDGIHVRGGRPVACRKIYGLLYRNLVTYICIELINKNLDVLKFLHWKIWNVLVWQFVYHVSALLYDKWIPVNYFFILFFSHYFHMPLFYAIIRINYIIAFYATL